MLQNEIQSLEIIQKNLSKETENTILTIEREKSFLISENEENLINIKYGGYLSTGKKQFIFLDIQFNQDFLQKHKINNTKTINLPCEKNQKITVKSLINFLVEILKFKNTIEKFNTIYLFPVLLKNIKDTKKIENFLENFKKQQTLTFKNDSAFNKKNIIIFEKTENFGHKMLFKIQKNKNTKKIYDIQFFIKNQKSYHINVSEKTIFITANTIDKHHKFITIRNYPSNFHSLQKTINNSENILKDFKKDFKNLKSLINTQYPNTLDPVLVNPLKDSVQFTLSSE